MKIEFKIEFLHFLKFQKITRKKFLITCTFFKCPIPQFLKAPKLKKKKIIIEIEWN